MSRPLIAQALWAHRRGIENDLRTLLLDQQSILKLYLVPDIADHHRRIAAIVEDYRANPAPRHLVTGLRLLRVPVFDADSDSDRLIVEERIERAFREDILLGVIFGQLSAHNLAVFADHQGPVGLKYAILDEISQAGLSHMPSFKKRLGNPSNSPCRKKAR